MLLPQEIAEQLTPDEYETLCESVYEQYKQSFGIVKATRKKGAVTVEVQLDDNTRHEIQVPELKSNTGSV